MDCAGCKKNVFLVGSRQAQLDEARTRFLNLQFALYRAHKTLSSSFYAWDTLRSRLASVTARLEEQHAQLKRDACTALRFMCNIADPRSVAARVATVEDSRVRAFINEALKDQGPCAKQDPHPSAFSADAETTTAFASLSPLKVSIGRRIDTVNTEAQPKPAVAGAVDTEPRDRGARLTGHHARRSCRTRSSSLKRRQDDNPSPAVSHQEGEQQQQQSTFDFRAQTTHELQQLVHTIERELRDRGSEGPASPTLTATTACTQGPEVRRKGDETSSSGGIELSWLLAAPPSNGSNGSERHSHGGAPAAEPDGKFIPLMKRSGRKVGTSIVGRERRTGKNMSRTRIKRDASKVPRASSAWIQPPGSRGGGGKFFRDAAAGCEGGTDQGTTVVVNSRPSSSSVVVFAESITSHIPLSPRNTQEGSVPSSPMKRDIADAPIRRQQQHPASSSVSGLNGVYRYVTCSYAPDNHPVQSAKQQAATALEDPTGLSPLDPNAHSVAVGDIYKGAKSRLSPPSLGTRPTTSAAGGVGSTSSMTIPVGLQTDHGSISVGRTPDQAGRPVDVQYLRRGFPTGTSAGCVPKSSTGSGQRSVVGGTEGRKDQPPAGASSNIVEGGGGLSDLVLTRLQRRENTTVVWRPGKYRNADCDGQAGHLQSGSSVVPSSSGAPALSGRPGVRANWRSDHGAVVVSDAKIRGMSEGGSRMSGLTNQPGLDGRENRHTRQRKALAGEAIPSSHTATSVGLQDSSPLAINNTTRSSHVPRLHVGQIGRTSGTIVSPPAGTPRSSGGAPQLPSTTDQPRSASYGSNPAPAASANSGRSILTHCHAPPARVRSMSQLSVAAPEPASSSGTQPQFVPTR